MTADVLAVYDLLASLVGRWKALPVGASHAGGDAERLLFEEARLLDDGRHGEWLDHWADDGALWVPLDPGGHPATDQSYFLDDVRRLRERVRWARSDTAWSQRAPLRTVRQVGNVESFTSDGELHVRSTITVHEQRAESRATWPMHQLHLFGDGRLRAKVLLVPAFAGSVVHPGVLL